MDNDDSVKNTQLPLADVYRELAHLTEKSYPPRRFSKAWFISHLDHFMISIVVSVAVSFASNIVMHHMALILHFMHFSAPIIRWLGY